MTAYIANHEKKRRIFAKREREILHAIKHGFTEEKLLLTAEKLRAAKVSVFKRAFSKDSVNQPHNFSPEEIAVDNKELQMWLSMSSEEIVIMYRARATYIEFNGQPSFSKGREQELF